MLLFFFPPSESNIGAIAFIFVFIDHNQVWQFRLPVSSCKKMAGLNGQASCIQELLAMAYYYLLFVPGFVRKRHRAETWPELAAIG